MLDGYVGTCEAEIGISREADDSVHGGWRMTLDISMPEVPLTIFSLADEDPDFTYHGKCEDFWKEVCDELSDPEYSKRSHHNVGTYDQGCRGPLCRKANREHPRRKRSDRGVPVYLLREERIFDPVLEYFHTVMKYRIRQYQQEIIKELA